MKTPFFSALVATLAMASPSYALPSPVAVPELDYKMAVGGLVIAVVGIALLIEKRRRHKAASN